MELGMIGLGRMGTNVVQRLRRAGHQCVVYDLQPDAVQALVNEGAVGTTSLEDFAKKLKKPRAAWMMVPAAVVDPTLKTLIPLRRPRRKGHRQQGRRLMTASRSSHHVGDRASSGQPFKRRALRTLLVSGVVCCGALAFVGSARVHAQGDSSAASTRKKIPAALPKIGEFGENVYDLAKARDWTKAAEKLAALEDAVKGLAADSTAARADKERLDSSIADLGRAVTTKDRQAAMREANRVTLIAANLTEPFVPKVPVDVTRLDYYGRELEVWAAAGDQARLKATATAMRKNVGPAVDELMARVEAAKSSREYGRVATPVLEAVDRLEKIFK